jgi:hypothetical protein
MGLTCGNGDMTGDRKPLIDAPISDVIGDRIRDLRTRAGMSRGELAEAAREAGAPAAFTATVVGFLESGRRDKQGRRQRHFLLDEVLAIAAALEVTPIELLGDRAVVFAGDAAPRQCPTCASGPGVLEATVRADVAALEDLSGVEASLAATAYVLARAIDDGAGEGGKQLPALSKELRGALEQIAAGRRGVEDPDDEDEFADLDSPDGDGPDLDGLD